MYPRQSDCILSEWAVYVSIFSSSSHTLCSGRSCVRVRVFVYSQRRASMRSTHCWTALNSIKVTRADIIQYGKVIVNDEPSDWMRAKNETGRTVYSWTMVCVLHAIARAFIYYTYEQLSIVYAAKCCHLMRINWARAAILRLWWPGHRCDLWAWSTLSVQGCSNDRDSASIVGRFQRFWIHKQYEFMHLRGHNVPALLQWD